MKKEGNILLCISVVYGFIETWFFGWNLYPKTIAEGICDTIALLLCLIGILLRQIK